MRVNEDYSIVRTLALETCRARLDTHFKKRPRSVEWFQSLRSLGLALTLLDEEEFDILLEENKV